MSKPIGSFIKELEKKLDFTTIESKTTKEEPRKRSQTFSERSYKPVVKELQKNQSADDAALHSSSQKVETTAKDKKPEVLIGPSQPVIVKKSTDIRNRSATLVVKSNTNGEKSSTEALMAKINSIGVKKQAPKGKGHLYTVAMSMRRKEKDEPAIPSATNINKEEVNSKKDEPATTSETASDPLKRSTVEVLRYSTEVTKVAISPKTTPQFGKDTAIMNLGNLLSSKAFEEFTANKIAEDVINIYISYPEAEEIILNNLKNLCQFGLLAIVTAPLKSKEEGEKAQNWLVRYNEFLVTLSTYEKGIEIISKYFVMPTNEKSHLNEVAQLICERHESKAMLFKMMPIYTAEDLKSQTDQSLFRNTTLSSSISKYYLTQQLCLPLENLADFVISKTKKPSEFLKHSDEKTNKKHSENCLKLAEEFLSKFYSLPMNANIKTVAKIRSSEIARHYSSAKTEKEIVKLSHSGISELLFLVVINPFLINHPKINPSKNKTPEELKKISKEQVQIAADQQKIVIILTKILQALANSSPILENPNIIPEPFNSEDMKMFNPLFKKFYLTHQKFIAEILQ